MPRSIIDGLYSVAEFRGFAESGMLDAAERGVNTVYWLMMLIALPPALWQHLVVAYSPIGLTYIVVPLVYVPVALGFFPRQPELRLYIAAVAFTVIGVSVNALYDWAPQPGLYLMIPSALIAFCIHGARGLGWLTLGQVAAVGSTSAILGISTGALTVYDLLTSLALWIAVVVACAMVVRQILDSSRFRARELETLTDRLFESEARLRDNTLSSQRILRVSLDGLREDIDQLSGDASEGLKVGLDHLRERIDELSARLLPPLQQPMTYPGVEGSPELSAGAVAEPVPAPQIPRPAGVD